MWPTSSFEEGESKYGADNYTVQFNVLDLASVILPVTTVSQTKDLPYHDFRPLTDRDEEIQSYYEPTRFDRMPVCIQVACRRLEEEKAIAVAAVVENSLKA